MFNNNDNHDSINMKKKKKKVAPPPPPTNTTLSFLHSKDHGTSDPGVNHCYSFPTQDDKFYDNRPRTGTYKKCKAPQPPRQIKLHQMFQQADTQTPSRLISDDKQDKSDNVLQPNNNNQVMQVFQFNSPPRTIKSAPAPAAPSNMKSSSYISATSSKIIPTSSVSRAKNKTLVDAERPISLSNDSSNAISKANPSKTTMNTVPPTIQNYSKVSYRNQPKSYPPASSLSSSNAPPPPVPPVSTNPPPPPVPKSTSNPPSPLAPPVLANPPPPPAPQLISNPPPPPAPPSFNQLTKAPVIKKQTKRPNQLPAPTMNIRDELMMAIRNCGGVRGLKPVQK